jgi:hypothetical protein
LEFQNDNIATNNEVMKMKLLVTAKVALLAAAMLAMSACGGGGGGSSPPPADTSCVLGTGQLGTCTL